jgi:imidazolonepropionase
MSDPCDLLVRNIGELVTLAPGHPEPIRGRVKREQLGVFAGPAAVAIRGRLIVAAGAEAEVAALVEPARTLDAGGKVVIPGFVDPHTHPAFVGTRQGEFAARCSGVPYQEIAAAGGGIRSSVRTLRGADEAETVACVRRHMDSLLLHGVTTAEVKSGYGLSTESEIRSLRAIAEVGAGHPVRMVATFLGAHEFPDEFQEDRDGYVELVCSEMIPRVAEEQLAVYCDVFCEEGVYTPAQARRVLEAARAAGLQIRLHADEFAPSGGAELAAEFGAHSADHLGAATEPALEQMAAADVVPVLLPGTSFYLGLPKPNVAWMLDRGMPVALGTDFNPGSSMTSSPQMIWTLACVQLGMSPAEALAAVTVNAAYSLRMADEVGRIAAGYRADLLLCDVPDWQYIPYHFGANHVDTVVCAGEVVVEGRRLVAVSGQA